MTIKYTGENNELLNKPLPYVYVGTRRTDGRIYIGARSANVRENRNVIDDFGIKYFTSSNNVIFDEFDWEILYIGNTKEEVFEFEGELIDAYLRAGVLVNKKGNSGFNNGGQPHSEESKLKMRKPKSEEHKESFSKARKGIPLSEEHKANMSAARKGKPLSEEHKQSLSKAKIGKPKSEEHKENMSKSLKGKPKSEEHKENMSKSLKGRQSPVKGIQQKTITCPHCGKSGGNSLMTRYHFDNCKNLKHIETPDMRTS
jgi:hypothetical protein